MTKGKKLFCQELVTGQNFEGFYKIGKQKMFACFFNFGDKIEMDTNNPVFLQNQNSYVVSLHDNFGSCGFISSRPGQPESNVSMCYIYANIIVIGPDKWKTTDDIKSLTFCIEKADFILNNTENARLLSKNMPEGDDTFGLCSANSKKVNITVRYRAKYSSIFDGTTDITPRFILEFNDNVSIYEITTHISCLVNFMSFLLGTQLKPSDIGINRLSQHQIETEWNNTHDYPEDHSVELIWNKTPDGDDGSHMPGSPVLVHNSDELMFFEKCLTNWINRNEAWLKPNILMMTCLRLKNKINGERMLNAYKWFDSIPLTSFQTVIKEEDIDAIAEVASSYAKKIGYGDVERRVAGAIKSIKTESQSERFSRNINLVRRKFGENILGDTIIGDLEPVNKFRGESAHESVDLEEDEKFQNFTKTIHALEALCFLLTAYDLPISTAGLDRIKWHYFVRTYHLHLP